MYSPLSDWIDRPADGQRISDTAAANQRQEAQPKFDAEPETTNHWRITIPPRLMELVRMTPGFLPAKTEAEAAPATEAGASDDLSK